MTTANEALLQLDDLKKVFYTDEVETHALAGIHLSIGRCPHRRARRLPMEGRAAAR